MSIIRFFMDANDEYVSLLRELNQEQEALVDGLDAGRQRLETLAQRIDDANPFYRLSLTLEGGALTGVALIPKYVGAEVDSPVEISFNLVGATAEEGSALHDGLRDALRWGEEVELPEDAVSDLVVVAPHGLGGHIGSARVKIGPAATESVALGLGLTVWAPDGERVLSLPATLERRVRGSGGVTLEGRDYTGVVRVKLRVDAQARNATLFLTYSEPEAQLPGALLPVLRFMRSAVAPNSLAFGVQDAPSTAAVPLSFKEDLEIDPYIEFVEGLRIVQDATGEPFAVPSTWTGRDQAETRRAVRLLRGERVRIGRGPATFSMDADAAEAFKSALGDYGHAIALAATAPYVAQICGHELDLGPWTFYVQNAVVTPGDPEPDGSVRFTVLPQDGSGVEAGLGVITHEPGSPAQ